MPELKIEAEILRDLIEKVRNLDIREDKLPGVGWKAVHGVKLEALQKAADRADLDLQFKIMHLKTIQLIKEQEAARKFSLGVTDDEWEDLYREFSETNYNAGWITPNVRIINSFIEWATHSPIQLLRRVKKERQENE